MKRTNVVLFVVVLALFAYVTLYERFTVSSGETASRASYLVPELVRDRLETVTVERDGSRYVLARGPRNADGDPTFRITSPMDAEADASRVLAALSDVEWAEPVRRLEGAGTAEIRRYGLERPRVRVTFEVGPETHVLAFGSVDATTGGVYASVGDAAFVVSSEVLAAFDREVAHFRVRRFAASLPEEPTRIRVRSPRGEVRVTRADGALRMESPLQAQASEGRFNVVLAFTRALEATRFVDENPSDLGRFGLAEPAAEVAVGDAGRPDAARLSIGGACEGHANERFARFGSGPVVCVAESDLGPLEVEPRAYLELRASATEAGGVTGFDLSDGRATISVTLGEEGARYRLGSTEGEADAEAVELWLETLRAARASDVVSGSGAFDPSITLTVHRTGGRADDVVRFAIAADGSVSGRRGQDAVLLRFDPSLGTHLAVSTMHFRSLSLIREDPGALRALIVDRETGREALRAEGAGALEVVEPVQVAAETARVGELAMRLAGLEAVRFVADSPSPAHGLARPRIVVAFTFRSDAGAEVSHRLRIGAVLDETAWYAQLDDSPTVFALAAATVELVATPLASRQELHTESLFVDTLGVRSGGRTVNLVRTGDRFTIEGQPAAEAPALAAVQAIASLRAAEVAGYGAPGAELGFGPASAEIRIVRGEEAGSPREIVLVLGTRRTVGGAERVAVRRTDRPVSYWVDARAIEPVLALTR